MLAPYLLSPRGPGAYVGSPGGGGGGGTGDGGFVDEPIVSVTAGGTTTIKGKVKPGSFGKFVYPLASIAAGRQYTFKLTPHFSQLSLQGKLAMTGFGFKNNNDFHIVGLRGDGSTGIHRYQVYGTPPNGWNKQTGHTVADGGASTNGSQAGPNWMRLVVSADGATYKFQTSGDSGSTWNNELTAQTPSPFSNVSSVVTFGIALWFNNADTGPFSIDIDQFADAFVYDDFVGALAYNSADASATFPGDPTGKTWDSEDVDTNSLHSTSSNTSRITIGSDLNGRYGIFTANINSDPGARYYLGIMKGGSPNYFVLTSYEFPSDGTTCSFEISTPPVLLSTSDYFECVPFMAGGATSIKASCSFSLMVVG